MTSETPNLHVSKDLNISRTKQDGNVILLCLKLDQKFFRCSGTLSISGFFKLLSGNSSTNSIAEDDGSYIFPHQFNTMLHFATCLATILFQELQFHCNFCCNLSRNRFDVE